MRIEARPIAGLFLLEHGDRRLVSHQHMLQRSTHYEAEFDCISSRVLPRRNVRFPGQCKCPGKFGTSGTVAGQAKSGEPSSGAGSVQLPSPNSEDQGGTGVKGSAQGEGATNKDTAPRDTTPR
jgi:hypothetical protein